MVKQIRKRAFAILMTLALVVSIIPVLTIPARAGVARTINCTNGVAEYVDLENIFDTLLNDECFIGFTFNVENPGLYFKSVKVGSTPVDDYPNESIIDGSNNIGDLVFTSATNVTFEVTVRIYDASLDVSETTTLTFISSAANATPTNISLSASSINENVIANTTVGTLATTDPDVGNTFTYTVVSVDGDTTSTAFNINGASLRISSSPNFETKSSYSVRVRTTDQGGLYFEKVFTITINDRNETPTDINLSPSSVDENSPSNTVVGTLTTTDPDSGNTFTYTPVAGSGSTDNASFNIDGSSLRMTNSSDYETKSSYSVRIRTTDQGGLYFEKSFTITINNINEPPTDITLTNTSINQSGGANAEVGTLGTTDVDNADSFSYTLVSGDGDTHNSSFNISGSMIRATDARALAAGTYNVRVRTTDSGNLTFEKAFTITVTDNVAPMVSTVSVPANDTYNVGQNLDFTVNYNEAVIVNTSGGTPFITVVIGGMNRQLAYVSGSGTSALVFRYTVQAGDGSFDGIGNVIFANGGIIQDAAGNNALLTLFNTSSTEGISIDTTAPTASSIVRHSPSNPLTNTASVIFRVTFNKNVTGVDVLDFTLTKTGDADGTVALVSPVSGTIYDVTVNTISGDGTLRLDLNASGTGIEDASGNAIAGGYSTGETYSIDNMAPTATISMSQTALYSGETATVTITFSEAVTGFTNDDLTISNGTLTAVSSADGGITWTATFTAANVDSATNSIVLALTGITDTAGNTGSGTASSGNYTVSMPTAPGAPTNVTATAGDTQASVSFTAPVSNGGAAITGYTVTSSPGGLTGTGAGSPITVTGLTNGVAYTFTVTATNGAGTGTASAASNSITPRATQTITFDNPDAQNFGTSPILTASSDSGLTVTFTSETTGVCTVTSGGVLTFITAGTATITAHQAGNASYLPATSVQRSFTVHPVAPGAPTGVTATAGDTQASVSFTAPVSTGGVAITGYTVTVSPADVPPVNGTSSPIVVTGLTNGQAYTFTVTATNSAGTGAASAASNSVTPRATQTITFDNPGVQSFGTNPTLTATSDSGLTVTFTSETPEVCTVTSGGVLTFISAGTATITANQAGNGSYLPAFSVSRTFIVNPIAPGAPTGVTVTAGSTQASVSFTAPVSNGGAFITGYTVTSSPGGFTGTGAGSPITVSGLTNGVAYTFTVTATNDAGTGATSAASNSVTPQAPVYDDTPSTPTTPPSNNAVVEVNGERQDAGTSATTTTDGQTVTTITVDGAKLDKILESSGENPTVTLPSTGSAVIVGELNGQTVKNMENNEATLQIKTDTVTYTLPASQLNIDVVSALLGSQVELKDIKVSVKIAEPAADTVRIVEDTANRGGYQLVVKPVEFEITCTNRDQTVEVSRFNGYVERTIAIPNGIDPSKITTGIVLNADGTFSHVPTQIIVINGKYYAKINSLTNSVYSVVYNPVTFKDALGHWAEAAINDMGSRMIVNSMDSGAYEPDRNVTRAEFAAIVVKALGLEKGTTESPFDDVTLTDWFNGYVYTATAYNLITGYDNESFAPNDIITREQAMTILARAMKLTGISVTLTDSEVAALFVNYTDAGLISDYARAGVAACIETAVVSGTTANTLSPKDSVTRAEVATMIQRLLLNSGLI